MKLVFEKSAPGRRAARLPEAGVPEARLPEHLARPCAPALPELSEADVVRHFTELSRRNFGVDSGFYPLGSCTMKYNPKINEELSRLAGFAGLHPLVPGDLAQGTLRMLHDTERMLCELTGMKAFSLAPAAGAHGELAGIMLVKAYHAARGEPRRKVLVPDSAHGTNPASAALCGYDVVSVKSDEKGEIDMGDLRARMGPDVAAIMLTNPNTLGLFETRVLDVARVVHAAGGLLYYDGANLNAIMGKCRPGDMGFDVVHLNLHKSFGAPHGGGGPGAGPVGVRGKLVEFLPVPYLKRRGRKIVLADDRPRSIGRLSSFYGNVGVILKAYFYLMSLGADGLREASETAVLNANYLKERLKGEYLLPHDRVCMHEFVLSASRQAEGGVHAIDIAKRLMDLGFHPPTVYFPLVVKEAMMMEPTETESLQTLEEFAEAMLRIAREARENPGIFKTAPHGAPVGRLDEVLAARSCDFCWKG